MTYFRKLAVYVPVLLFLGGYYYWQCAREDDSWRVWNIFAPAPDHLGGYGDLTNGFLHHSLGILTPPDPRLALVQDPYDPNSRKDVTDFQWDYSYYKGRYYLYFGPVPAVVIDLPWHFIFGYVPAQHLTLFLLGAANLLLFAVLLHMLSTYYFPRVPTSFQGLILILYAFANLLPFLLSAPEMYQIAIGGGALFTLSFFVMLLFALQHEARRSLGFALASASAGLAMGSRPTTVFLLLLLAFCWGFYHWRRPAAAVALKELAAITVPATLFLATLFWYNYARFGNILQFGNHYLLNWGNVYFKPNFEWRNIPDAIWTYCLQPWHTTAEFPCVGLGSDINPPGWIYLPDREREAASGMFLAAPIVLVSGLWWFYARKLAPVERTTIGLFGGLLSVWAAFFAILISAFFYVAARYEVELQLPLLLLTTLTLLARRNRGPFATWELVSFIVLFQVSCYIGFAFGLIGKNNWIQNYFHPGS